jgi:CBS-domain-containing membrane protein
MHLQSQIYDFGALNRGAVESARAELESVRAIARDHQLEFSLETMHSWLELDHSIEDRLDDLEGRMSDESESAEDVALARIRELTREVERLMERHSCYPASAVMRTEVFVCSRSDMLEQAARTMWDHDCGALPVLDESGTVMAMITDRDICMATFMQGRAPNDCSVVSAMSSGCRTCAPDDSIQRVLELMAMHQLRRLPVVDSLGKLVGIVTLADIARYMNGLSPGHHLRELLAPTLAAIADSTRSPASMRGTS